VLYVIGHIYTSATHASADFFAFQSRVTCDATDYIAINLANRSVKQRRFSAVLNVTS